MDRNSIDTRGIDIQEFGIGPFETFVFDLDGTLLDTLPDLVVLTNRALRESGFPERTEEEILSFVGFGLRSLMSQAVPQDAGKEAADAAMQLWRDLYPAYGADLTRPYPGMVDIIAQLKQQGKKLAVLSNKFDGGVQDIIPIYFPGMFDAMHGECDAFPRKPDPTGLLKTIAEIGGTPETALYVGDSGGDMDVAHNANIASLGVTWGYRPEEELRDHKAHAIIHKPEDILLFT